MKKFGVILVVCVWLCFSCSLASYAITLGGENGVLGLFSNAIQGIFAGNESYLSNVTFRIALGSVISEDQYGSKTFMGEFGPDRQIDSLGNELSKWEYKSGKRSRHIQHSETGDTITSFDDGKQESVHWDPNNDVFNDDAIAEIAAQAGLTEANGGILTDPETGELTLATTRYNYDDDGVVSSVNSLRIDNVEGEPGEIENVEAVWQTTTFDSNGRRQEVRDSEGNLTQDVIYDDSGMINYIDVYGGEDDDDPNNDEVVTQRIYYEDGREDRVTRIGENGENPIAQVHYDGAKRTSIVGEAEGIQALGFAAPGNLNNEECTLNFNDMGLPTDIVDSGGTLVQEWIYAWDLPSSGDLGWGNGADAQEILQSMEDIAGYSGVRTVGTVTRDGNGKAVGVNLLGMFNLNTTDL